VLLSPAPITITGAAQTTLTYRLLGGKLFPEGIAVFGDQFYVSGSGRGDIHRGDLSESTAHVFIRGDRGPGFFVGGGIKATADNLVVAQEFGGLAIVTVYDRQTGALVVRFSGGPDSAFTNDLDLAPNGDAYVTNSLVPVLYRIPAAALNQAQQDVQPLPVFLSWDGTPFEFVPDTVNANGIVVSPDGQFLLVVSFASGQLFRVRLADREVTEVDLGGASLLGGDGMVLTADRVLYVVLAPTNEVVKLQMDATYKQGELVSRTTDPTFVTPTTAAIAGQRLLVVNSQFFGPAKPPWTVSSIPLP